MAKFDYGEVSGQLDDVIAKMQAGGVAQDELNRKLKEYDQTQERSSQVEEQNATVRTSLADATERLATSLREGTSLIAADTSEWSANNAVLQENLRLRRELSQYGAVTAPAAAPITVMPEREPVASVAPQRAAPQQRVAPAPVTMPSLGVQGARDAEMAAQIEAERARNAVAEARKRGAPPEEVGALTGQRTQANEAANAARRARQAAERQAQAMEEAAVAAESAAAAERAVAEAEYRAAQASMAHAPAGMGGAVPGGYGLAPVAEAEQQRQAARREEYRFAQASQPYAPAGAGGAPPGGGFVPPAPPAGAGGGGEPPEEGGGGRAAAEMEAYNEKLAGHQKILEGARTSQEAFNVAEQEASARYAESSNALSRHGALTTEFIQALARGNVTLQEFGSQMVSTVGKFGGWIVAGAAIYGVIKLFDDLKNGATETNAAIQNLGRFLPGLGGPAGGGSGQVGAAQNLLRNISTQFNVPISEVGDTMQITSRVFKDLGGAGEATRAALAASRLDQIPVEMSTQYLLGIAQSTGMPTTGPGAGSGLVGVINSLNSLQVGIGARVSQTLPAVARAAPAAVAAGMPLDQLEAITGVAVRAGIPGGQVGTALARSLSTFVFRPAAQQLFAHLGIAEPTATDAGSIYGGVFQYIDRQARSGRPVSQVTLRSLAGALASPQIGARSILPLLEAEQLHPGTAGTALGLVQRPRAYQEDLAAVTSTVTEQFKHIGIALQSFGSQLASIGALTPITDMFWVLTTLGHAFQTLVTPVETIVSAFNKLPTPIENVAAALLAIGLGRAAYQRTFLGSAAQQFVGRVPGFESVGGNERAFLRQRRADIQNVLLPEAGQEQMAARRQRVLAATAQAQAYGTAQGMEPEEGAAYIEAAQRKATEAQERDERATERVAALEEDLAVIRNTQYTWAEKSAVLEQRGYIALEESVSAQEEYKAVAAARLAAVRGGGGGPPIAGGAGGAVEGGVGSIAGAAVVAGAVAADVLNSPATVSQLTDNLAASRSRGAGPMGGAPLAEGAGLVPIAMGGEPQPRVVEAPSPEEPPPIAPIRTGAPPPIMGVAAEDTAQGAAMRSALGATVAAQQAALGGGAALDRVMQGGVMSRIGAGASALAGSSMLPFAGMIGSQLLGGMAPGGLGDAISSVGTTAFMGMMFGQMLPGGAATTRLGLGVGLLAAGRQQGGALGGILGGIGGGVTGANVASLGVKAALALAPADAIPGLDVAAVPLQVGLAVGGTVLGAILGSGGGGKSAQDKQQQAMTDAQKQANQMVTQSVANQSQIDQFGGDFSDALNESFTGTGQSASAAQAKVQKVMENLTAQMQVFGAGSARGRQAQAELGQVLSAATATQDIDPSGSQQIVQGVQSAMQNTVTRTSMLLKYASPDQIPGLLQGGLAQLNVTPQLETDLQQAEAQRSRVQGSLQRRQQQARQQAGAFTSPFGALGGGDYSQQIAELEGKAAPDPYAKTSTTALQSISAGLDNKIANLKANLQYIDVLKKDMADQLATAAFTAQEAVPTAQAQIAESQTADPLAQSRITIANTRKQISDLTNSSRSQAQKTIALGPLRQQLQQEQQGQAQAEVSLMTATGSAAASAIPSVDPVARAAEAVKNTGEIYKYIRAHMNLFSPEQLQQALANANAAGQSMADAVYQYSSELLGSQEQLAEAQARGDPTRVAAAQTRFGQSMLGIARTPAQRNVAQAQVISGQTAAAEAQRQTIQAEGQIAQARDYGNTVAQANDSIRLATALLNTAVNPQEKLSAQAQLLAAQTQAEQAMADRQNELGSLLASETTDPVTQARDVMEGAARALTHTKGTDARIKAQTSLNQSKTQWEQATIDQRESLIDFQFQMSEITSGQAIKGLQDLLKMQGLTKEKRQQILEEIRRYQLGLETPIGGGTFDLAPGNIKLPTYYDTFRGLRGGRPAATGTMNASVSAPTQINVYVRQSNDVPKVADAIDRATSSHLRQKLRAAGVR